MTHEHILSAFDRDLESIQAAVMKMGGVVEEALRNAVTALATRDVELAERVRAGDRAVDEMDLAVKSDAARILALRAPAASDLRAILAVIEISSHLERCGDYAKNIAKRTRVLAGMSEVGGAVAALRRMALFVEQMLSDALDAYIRKDAPRAEEIVARDAEADQMYNVLFRSLLTHMMEDPRNITACMHLHFIAKNIERIGDHATGIAEQVIYLVTGALPEDDRPKEDRTSGELRESED
ncbi:phosphate signaling complex protein PhoU [Albidovulum sp.]